MSSQQTAVFGLALSRLMVIIDVVTEWIWTLQKRAIVSNKQTGGWINVKLCAGVTNMGPIEQFAEHSLPRLLSHRMRGCLASSRSRILSDLLNC